MEEKINKNSNLKKELKHTNLKNTDKRKLQAGEKEKSSEHCPYAKKCGGCDYQGFSYKKQLEKKQSYMRKLMEPFGKINPIVGMDNPYHYRHKVQAAFSCTKRGHIVAGSARETFARCCGMWSSARLRMSRRMQSLVKSKI